LRAGTVNEELAMRAFVLRFVLMMLIASAVAPVCAGDIFGISYTDLATTSSTDLTTAGTLDWVKWGNGDATNTTDYAISQKTGGSIINTALTPLGTVPQGQSVVLEAFAPPPAPTTTPSFSWSDGTSPMAGGNPVSTSVSETIFPNQSSYPLGLGLSLQVAADAAPRELDLYVVGFNARMQLTATLSGGGTESLIASSAALNPVPVPTGGNNYDSYGIFSILYSGAGETLTVNLTADDQSGIPTSAPQFGFPNAGVFAATVNVATVPEPSSWVLSALGLGGVLGYRRLRRRTE
jgi:hypothetical protein